MLAAIPKLTEEIQEGLGCVDHILNLVVTECLGIPEVKYAVDAFKKLSSRTHKSSIAQQRIKKECVRINNQSKDDTNIETVEFVKIIAPVETRCNSILMMMRSILKLRPALERIRENFSKGTNPKLREKIPTSEEFEQIVAIIGPLTKIKEMSLFFSSDQKTTICYVVLKLFNIDGYLNSQLNKPTISEETKVFCKTLQSTLEKRFPACGTKNKLYAYRAILHPFYKGLTLAQHESSNYRE
ncbi:uncharacterized protein LOC124818636 [Hydra vulgaris]|uniref:uncharacterized protein LOC124818636 n=1 Tax=Hydra vulgaris TaxID=6087 RepID=UPI0032EA7DB0